MKYADIMVLRYS